MSLTTPPPERWTALSRFMVDASQVPDATFLAERGLEALAYTRVPNTHPEHRRWREAYLHRIATHLAVRAELAPLIRTWREHGIEVLLFKGFYLAEFVYENPAERFYKDVDVLVPEADAARAISLASGCGWTVRASRTGVGSSNLHSHMEAILVRANVLIDLHRFVVHKGASPDDRQARRYTAAAWAASREVPWEGGTVRVLDARDSALLGIITGRAWSHDGWRLKAPDYRDLEVLAEREGLSRDALSARASELGCPLTLRLLLDRCDPWRRHLDMVPPTPAQVRRWARAVSRERGQRIAWRRPPPGASIGGLLRALPGLMRARRLVSRHLDAAALQEHVRWEHAGVAGLTPASRMRLFGSIRLGAVLVQPFGDRCLVRSVALFERLRAHGEPVRLRLGVDSVDRLHGWIQYGADGDTPVESWLHCPVSESRGSLPPEPAMSSATVTVVEGSSASTDDRQRP